MKKKYIVSGAVGLALVSAIGAWASYNKIKKGSYIGRSKKAVQEFFGVEPTPYEPENPVDRRDWHKTYSTS